MTSNRNVNIITDENNRKIVIINDKKFKGLTKDDWKQIEIYLKDYISDCYEITETSEFVYIGPDFPSEYSGSNSRLALKGARKKAKASASQGIPELIQIAQNPRWEENKERKHIKDAKYGWYRYDIRFGIPVYDQNEDLERYNIYTVKMLVRHDADGKLYLYDIIRTKKETSTPSGLL